MATATRETDMQHAHSHGHEASASSASTLPSLPSYVLDDHQHSMESAVDLVDRLSSSSSTASSDSSSSSILSPLSTSSSSSSVVTSSSPMRINSLDAASLDSELHLMLSHSMRRIFKYHATFAAMKPELELALGAIVFGFTIGQDQPTPGMKLQNLTWQNQAAITLANEHHSTTATPSSSTSTFQRLSATVWKNLAILITGYSPKAHGLSTSSTSAAAVSRLDELRSLLPTESTTAISNPIALSNFEPMIRPFSSSPSSSKSVDAVLVSSLSSSSPTLLSRRQKCLYFIFSLLIRYGWSKLSHHMTMEGWGGAPNGSYQKRIYQIVRRIEQIYQAASIMNFIIFLKNGCYRSLLERLLSIRLLYIQPNQSRSLSFEFMNQQIAWSALSEFMLFLLPLINFGLIQDGWRWMREAVGLGGDRPESLQPEGCPVCARPIPTQPYRAQPCGCVYCYYCLAGSRLAAQQQQRGAVGSATTQFQCIVCQTVVQSQAPL